MDISLNPITRCTPRRNTPNIKQCMKSKRYSITQTKLSNGMDFEQQIYKLSNCMHKMTRVQLLFNDKASSSTLIEGLAPHDNKRHNNIN